MITLYLQRIVRGDRGETSDEHQAQRRALNEPPAEKSEQRNRNQVSKVKPREAGEKFEPLIGQHAESASETLTPGRKSRVARPQLIEVDPAAASHQGIGQLYGGE